MKNKKAEKYLFILLSLITFVDFSFLVTNIFHTKNLNSSEYIDIEFAIDTPINDTGVFYYDIGYGFSEDYKVIASYTGNILNVKIPQKNKIKSIRFDPFSRPGKILIKEIKFNDKKIDFQILDLTPIFNIERLTIINQNKLLIDSNGDDPAIILTNDIHKLLKNNKTHWNYIVSYIVLILLFLLSVYKIGFILPNKILETDIVLSTLSLSVALIVVDIYLRNSIFQSANFHYFKYTINFFIIFSGLFIIKFIIILFRFRYVKLFLAVWVALISTTICIIQYKIFYIYNSFITPEMLKTLILDFQYWLMNSSLFLDAQLICYSFLTFCLFFIYFSGYYSKFISYKITHYSILKSQIFILPISFFIFASSMHYLNAYSYLLSPLPQFISEVNYLIHQHNPLYQVSHIRNYKKITSQKVDFNILLIVNESLRSDHLETFQYKKNTSKNIKLFFKDSYKFKNCISQTAVTHTSLESIFTGMYPVKSTVSDSPTLWPYMKQVGFHTFYFGSQMLSWSGGLDKYFLEKKFVDKLFYPLKANSAVGHDDSITTNYFIDYIKNVNDVFFGVLHFNSTHFPYIEHKSTDIYYPTSHEIDINQTQGLINSYDNALQYLDIEFSKIIKSLQDVNKIDNTVILFLSDHAEAFGEHGELFHTKIFWIEAIRTPLLVYIPDRLKLSIGNDKLKNLSVNTKKYVANIDILPTLFDLLKIDFNTNSFDGQSLFEEAKNNYVLSTMTFSDEIFTFINRVTFDKYLFDNRIQKLFYSNLKFDPNENQYTSFDLLEKYNRKTGIEFIKNNRKLL